jgi:hypothetical protein
VLQQFRAGSCSATEAAAQLQVSKRRLYQLFHSFLKGVAQRRAQQWSPRLSGGARRPAWPTAVKALVVRLLKAKPPCSYSLIASECLRRLGHRLDRATVRRFALQNNLAPQKLLRKPLPVRRWQTQKIGQLWQYDASPHRWFVDQDWQPSLLHLMDDHSRVVIGAKLYERETLLAHLDFLSQALQATGLPLSLYVDFHSFFFSHLPEGRTQLAESLRFYDVSLRFAPTPQAKGKIERGHQFWQKRFPALLAADAIATMPEANALLEVLRRHHNTMEKHREIRSTPQAAWDLAKKENRSALRPAPACPWWPYVFSQRTRIRVGDDGRVAVGNQRLSVNVPPRSKVIHCQHPNGDITVLQQPPQRGKLPVILLSTRLC